MFRKIAFPFSLSVGELRYGTKKDRSTDEGSPGVRHIFYSNEVKPCKKACLHWLVDSSGYEGTLNFNRVESRDIQKASWAQPCPDPLPTQPRQIRQSCGVYSRQRWHQCLLLASLCSPWVINMNHNDPEGSSSPHWPGQPSCRQLISLLV